MQSQRFTHRVFVAPAANWVLALLVKLAKLAAIEPANVYRPERHYMRGPGPKWREKNGPATRL
jgi:hypothetical protein